MATHFRVLPGQPHGQRILVSYSSWGHKESDMTEYTRSQKFGTRLLLYKHKFLLCTAL